MEFIIRPAHIGELDDIIALAAGAPEIADFENEGYSFFSKEQLEIMCASPDVAFLVAADGSEIAGFCIVLFHRAAGMGYVVDMVVRDGFRKKGIGRQFLKQAVAFAQKQGGDEIWAIVHEKNKPALDLFEKENFQTGRKFFFVGKSW